MTCHWGRCLWWGCVDDGRSTNLAPPDLVHDLYLFSCFVYFWRFGPESGYLFNFVQKWSSKNILKHSMLHKNLNNPNKSKTCPIYFPLTPDQPPQRPMTCHWGRCLWWGCVDDGRSTNLALQFMIGICSVVFSIFYVWGPKAVIYHTLNRIDPQKTY